MLSPKKCNTVRQITAISKQIQLEGTYDIPSLMHNSFKLSKSP